MANVQHIEMFQGETRTFTLFARDPSNVAKSLSGLTIAWNVGRRPNDPTNRTAVFTKSGSIVSAPAGSFSVSVAAADTSGLTPGNYEHVAETSDGLVVCAGRFHLKPNMD